MEGKWPLVMLMLLSVLPFVTPLNYKPRSKLHFINGGYQNLLVGIGEDVEENKCQDVVDMIKDTLTRTSAHLHFATESKASFHSIKILLPERKCLSITPTMTATPSESFTLSHIKVTDANPLATQLPWTRQYRHCSFGGEDIFVPISNFLISSTFRQSEKGRLIFHEWGKFRYGVYEEFGYFGDPLVPGCSNYKNGFHMTGCTSLDLPKLIEGFGGDDEGSCRAEMLNKKDEIRDTILRDRDTSSVMFIPYLDQVTRFCDDETHNKYSRTKQNIFCEGRSIKDVVDKHPDFVGAVPRPELVPTFQVIRHRNNGVIPPGYVFIIENTQLIRQQSRLRYIKQFLTSMIDMIPLWAKVMYVPLAEGGGIGFINTHTLSSEAVKAQVVQDLPDLDTLPNLGNSLNITKSRQGGGYDLKTILDRVLDEVNIVGSQINNWHMYLITNSPSSFFSEAKDSLGQSDVTLSIFSFEDIENYGWMSMYGTPNMKNYIPLQSNCGGSDSKCSDTAKMLLHDFIESMRLQFVNKAYWQKGYEGSLTSGDLHTINIDQVTSMAPSYKFYITLFQTLNSPGQISVSNPRNQGCSVGPVLGYPYIVSVTDCSFEPGEWTIDLRALSTGIPPSHVSVWFQTLTPTLTGTEVFTTLGRDRGSLVNPNDAGVPVFVRVSSQDKPMIMANVRLYLQTRSLSMEPTPLSLRDDGVDPDIVKNDGVYSTYLLSFGGTSSYHFGVVEVSTSQSSQLVTSIGSSQANLLDDKMSPKCCGSSVPWIPSETLGWGKFTSILSGFQISHTFDPGSLPPSRIGQITIDGNNGNLISISFIAPGSSLGRDLVLGYQTCCSYFNENDEELSSCHNIPCTPVQPWSTQRCDLERDSLYKNHLHGSQYYETIILSCGLRAVDGNGRVGMNSTGSFTVTVSDPSKSKSSSDCDSFSDGCFPKWFFWALIGAIGGLLLIILVLILVWCLSTRKKKKVIQQDVVMTKSKATDLPSVQTQTQTPTKLPGKDSSVNVYVNKAYIQETDGTMKLVATDGKLVPLDGLTPPDMVSESDADTIAQRQPPVMIGSNVVQVSPVRRSSLEDMKLYKSTYMIQVPAVLERPALPPKPARQTLQYQHQASFPVPRDRVQKQNSEYANNRPRPRPPPLDFQDVPLYASVSRKGRPRTPLQSPSSGFLTFKPPPPLTPRPRPPEIPIQFKPSMIREQTPFSTLPRHKRFDAFPSSDSDTYSDRMMGPSPQPPPFPPHERQRQRQRMMDQPPPQPPPFPPHGRERPRILTRQETVPTTPSSPPPYPPPPPPPPQGIQRQQNTYDDEDSEHWSDEEYEIRVPESYA